MVTTTTVRTISLLLVGLLLGAILSVPASGGSASDDTELRFAHLYQRIELIERCLTKIAYRGRKALRLPGDCPVPGMPTIP